MLLQNKGDKMKTQNEMMKFLHDNAIEQLIKDAKANGRTLTTKSIALLVADKFSKAGQEITARYAEYMMIGYKTCLEVA